MREKLISVAIRRFGKSGFDGASTRDIAAEAGTTMSNITYHFGGKEGLYRAAAEAIVARFREVTENEIATLPGPEATPRERADMVCGVLLTIGAFMLRDEAKPLARFVAREQQNPKSIMREYFQRDIHPFVDRLEEQVGRLRPDLDPLNCKATVFYLVSMAISLRSSRLSLCIFMGVEDIDERLAQMLLSRLDATVRQVLGNVA